MNILEIMQQNQSYCSNHRDMPSQLQQKAKQLCWEYNKTSPKEGEKRAEILRELFGDCHPLTFIEPSFRCDYGFNIHTYGLTVINYNCVILDTSPVHIGKNVFIAVNEKSMDNYQKLNVNGIIDECFNADFGIDSKISKYVQKQILKCCKY